MAETSEPKMCSSGCVRKLHLMVCVLFALKIRQKLTKPAGKLETAKNTSTLAASITDSMNNLKLDDATKPNVVEVSATPAPSILSKRNWILGILLTNPKLKKKNQWRKRKDLKLPMLQYQLLLKKRRPLKMARR